MNAAEISHSLKVFGNGDEQTGMDNLVKGGAVIGYMIGVIDGFKEGEIVGSIKTAVAITVAYGCYRLGKWGMEKADQSRLKKENRQQILESN
ncbi:MAG: hypothetical protein IJE08_09930 [Clostridia bacterium]|nr:hypothetical protein [Clostridia bacterium]